MSRASFSGPSGKPIGIQFMKLASALALVVAACTGEDAPPAATDESGDVRLNAALGQDQGGLQQWSPGFGDPNGANIDKYYETIRYPDLNNDGLADICGRGTNGVWCALSTGTGFAPATLWSNNFSDTFGWGDSEAYWSTLEYVDVNRDGRADVCGRGVAGMYCALSTGTAFGAVTPWSTAFSDGNGWLDRSRYKTIQIVDLDRDGFADICARSSNGIYCGYGNGSTFSTPTYWSTGFNDADGWNGNPAYYESIRFADVSGDSFPDVCGRNDQGMFCARQHHVGGHADSFFLTSLWQSQLNANWTSSPAYWSTIQFADINNDGFVDVCGRGVAGLYCAQSTGVSFGALSLVDPDFADATGWLQEKYYSTIRIADESGDGRADICARGAAGWWCAYSTSTSSPSFAAPRLVFTGVSDATFWGSNRSYYSTLRPARTDRSALTVCGRGQAGIYCNTAR